VPDTPLPWLLGVARNLLRRQRDGGNRRRALADRIAVLTTPEDLAAWDVADHVIDHVIERDSALAAVAARTSRPSARCGPPPWTAPVPRRTPGAVRPTSPPPSPPPARRRDADGACPGSWSPGSPPRH
jgi:RNA polymerase sigma-70 factor (ECF subfamily)